MHTNWWDPLWGAAFVSLAWSGILYGTLRQFKVNNPWPVVVGAFLVNASCFLLGGSAFLKYLGVA